MTWRKNLIWTSLERDLAALGFGLSPALKDRFWTMLAHYRAQVWKGSEIAASLGIAPNTARAYQPHRAGGVDRGVFDDFRPFRAARFVWAEFPGRCPGL